MELVNKYDVEVEGVDHASVATVVSDIDCDEDDDVSFIKRFKYVRLAYVEDG